MNDITRSREQLEKELGEARMARDQALAAANANAGVCNYIERLLKEMDEQRIVRPDIKFVPKG